MADPTGFDATRRYIPSSVKVTRRITRDPLDRILNRSSDGMGSNLVPKAFLGRGEGHSAEKSPGNEVGWAGLHSVQMPTRCEEPGDHVLCNKIFQILPAFW